MAGELLAAADKYLLDQLKTACEKHLLHHMSPENCVELLLHADFRHPEDHLKDMVKFFRRFSSEVMATDKWKKTKQENPRLVCDMLENVLSSDNFGTTKVTEGTITNGMAKLFVDQSLCDLHFHSADGNFVGPHIAILSIGSPVFAAMFNSEMLGSETREVYIDDIDTEVFRQLLLFLYTGYVPNMVEESFTRLLYEAPDKYGIDLLMDECVDKLLTPLTLDNSIELLIPVSFQLNYKAVRRCNEGSDESVTNRNGANSRKSIHCASWSPNALPALLPN